MGSPIKDSDEFWNLVVKPSTEDTRLSTAPVVILSRETLQSFFKQLRDILGPKVDDVLYE